VGGKAKIMLGRIRCEQRDMAWREDANQGESGRITEGGGKKSTTQNWLRVFAKI